MNRMWVRLSLAMIGVVILSLVVVALASIQLSQNATLQNVILEEMRNPGGLVDELSAYYAEHGSWNGVEDFMLQSHISFAFAPELNLAISLVDDKGKVILGFKKDRTLDGEQITGTLPVVVNGQQEGEIALVRLRLPPPNNGQNGVAFFRRVIDILLFLLAVTGIFSVIFGILVSRTLTRPLNRLAQAARGLGSRNLSLRARVEGTTEVADLARAFNEMADGLEKGEMLRRNLVADVAHELRTPLSVLQGNLRAILDDVYPMSKTEIVKLYEQTRLLGRLVNDLHELSQAEAKQLPLNLSTVDAAQLVRDQAETFGGLAEQAGVALKIDVPETSLPIRIDSARLSQIIGNLIMNALSHTPSGGSITVQAKPAGEMLTLSVQDTGDGIDSKHMPFIFERFYRADPSRARETGGAGLGLAIARALVEAQGGSLQAESAGTGQGSTFLIRLPTVAIKP